MATKGKEEYAKAEQDEEDVLNNFGSEMDKIKDQMVDGNIITAKDLKEENFGEYVDYGINLNENGKPDDWKIFYVGGEEDGGAKNRIFIISSSYVRNENTTLTEALNNCGMIKSPNGNYNYHCSAWTSAPSFKGNINAELYMATGFDVSTHQSNKNSLCVASLLCTENWKGFKNDYAESVIGGPTLEMWVASWNKKYGNEYELDCSQVNDYGYFTKKKGENSAWGIDLSATTGYNDSLFFNSKSENNFDEKYPDGLCRGYFVASTPAINSTGMLAGSCFGSIGTGFDFNGNGDARIKIMGIRPLVALKSNVYLTKQIKNGEEIYKINL